MTAETADQPTAAASCPYHLDKTGSDIHAEASQLRQQGPVKVVVPGDVQVWSINSHSGIKSILSNPRVTKSARTHWPAFRNGEIRPDWELISWVAMDNMVTNYGKDLQRLRRLVAYAFSPKRVAALKPRIEGIANALLDELAKAPGGTQIDLRASYAYPLPAMIVAELVGMSDEARTATAKVIDMMVDTTVSPEQAQVVLAGWRGAIEQLIAEKRANPQPDLTTDLLAAKDEDGSRLSEQELVDSIFAVLGAGSETTINFLDNAITNLLNHPDQKARVLSGEIPWHEVIEETLRVESPLAHLPLRYAAEDVEVDGVTIPQGDPILINYASVGRDPELNGPNADEFMLDREDKKHLSFGYGPHYCLGVGVARAVAEIGLATLFNRFPNLTMAPDVHLQPLPTFIMNGHQALPVVLHHSPPESEPALQRSRDE